MMNNVPRWEASLWSGCHMLSCQCFKFLIVMAASPGTSTSLSRGYFHWNVHRVSRLIVHSKVKNIIFFLRSSVIVLSLSISLNVFLFKDGKIKELISRVNCLRLCGIPETRRTRLSLIRTIFLTIYQLLPKEISIYRGTNELGINSNAMICRVSRCTRLPPGNKIASLNDRRWWSRLSEKICKRLFFPPRLRHSRKCSEIVNESCARLYSFPMIFAHLRSHINHLILENWG